MHDDPVSRDRIIDRCLGALVSKLIRCELCKKEAVHAEHFYARIRGWCLEHTPWSGHYEHCPDPCSKLIYGSLPPGHEGVKQWVIGGPECPIRMVFRSGAHPGMVTLKVFDVQTGAPSQSDVEEPGSDRIHDRTVPHDGGNLSIST